MHKKIGILGGMSPESTIEYYQYITHTYTQRFGDYGYPKSSSTASAFNPTWIGQWRTLDLVTRG